MDRKVTLFNVITITIVMFSMGYMGYILGQETGQILRS